MGTSPVFARRGFYLKDFQGDQETATEKEREREREFAA